jgi:hypothetical protein
MSMAGSKALAPKRTTRGTNFKIKYQIKLLFKDNDYCRLTFDPSISPKDNQVAFSFLDINATVVSESLDTPKPNLNSV